MAQFCELCDKVMKPILNTDKVLRKLYRVVARFAQVESEQDRGAGVYYEKHQKPDYSAEYL